MKKSFVIISYLLLLIILTLSIYNFFSIKETKIACIDNAKVLNAYHGIDELNKTIEQENKTLKLRLDTLAKEFEQALKEYEKKRAGLSEKGMRAEEEM